MFKERIKSSVIFLLIVNMFFLTTEIWFVQNSTPLSIEIANYFQKLPVIERFFPAEREYSFPKENLSMPRKFLVNDGSLWMAYYNTDIGFSPIEERTSEIINAFLRGETSAVKPIDAETWEAGLESLSIYIEYPISYSMSMFCNIMGVNTSAPPEGISSVKDFVIIPSSNDTDVCLLVRDAGKKGAYYAYMINRNYSLPAEDLAVYASTDDVYYEPAFSTGLELGENSGISLSPLVLFSDSQPEIKTLISKPLINNSSSSKLLEGFGFNPLTARTYEDKNGSTNYIENYASIKIYPDNIIEYSPVSEAHGMLLDESQDAYSVLNASIDFAEKIWGCVSDDPLKILLSSNLDSYDSSKPYTFRFDYYSNGMPVEIDLQKQYGHNAMNCALEMTVKNGRLVSYRQYMTGYETTTAESLSEPFISALDNFVKLLDKGSKNDIVIKDIYIGYLDMGNKEAIKARWLAKVDNDKKAYYYQGEEASVE